MSITPAMFLKVVCHKLIALLPWKLIMGELSVKVYAKLVTFNLFVADFNLK